MYTPTPTTPLCSTRADHLRIDQARMPLLGIVACNFKKFPTITQDLTMEMHRYEGESVSTYPCRPLAEASHNAVDVVEQSFELHRSSVERTAPPSSNTRSAR
jgi:hypothetical protein